LKVLTDKLSRDLCNAKRDLANEQRGREAAKAGVRIETNKKADIEKAAIKAELLGRNVALTEQLEQIKAKLESEQAKSTDLAKKQGGKNSTLVGRMFTSTTMLQMKLAAKNRSMTRLQKRLSEIDEDLKQARKVRKEGADDYEDLQKEYEKLLTAFDDSESGATDSVLRARLEEVEGRLETFKVEKSTIQEECAELRAEKTVLQAELKALNEEVSTPLRLVMKSKADMKNRSTSSSKSIKPSNPNRRRRSMTSRLG
jgi:chromosome segregation ATPase